MKYMKYIKSIYAALIMVAALLGYSSVAYGATANIKVAGGSADVGAKVTVTVTTSSEVQIGAAQIYINYDASMLEYVSGADSGAAGTVTYIDTDTFTTKSRQLVFKVLKAGSSTVTASSGSRVASMSYENMEIKSSAGTVTGNAPRTASSDNKLSSLIISPSGLTPAFSPDILEYKLTIKSDVDKLVVTAKANDKAAKIAVSGTRMDPGDNRTTVTVTAEDGSKRVYLIKTYKEEGTSTTNPTKAPVVVDSVSVTVGDKKYAIDSDFSTHPLPEGFVEAEIEIEGAKVIAGQGFGDKLTIVYLSSLDGKDTAGYFVYDSVKSSYVRFLKASDVDVAYTYLPVTSGMEIPSGFELETVEIEGVSIDVLKPSGRRDSTEYYLFYGMDSNGNTDWFVYDMQCDTIQRFMFDGAVGEMYEAPITPEPDRLDYVSGRNDRLKSVVVVFSLVLSLVCLGIAVVAVLKGKRR